KRGFDQWVLGGATQQVAVDGLAAIDADNNDPAALSGKIETLAALTNTWRDVGANVYRTFFDAILARLMIAGGHPDRAREWLEAALQLAQDTEMHFYDAELLRIRAHTHSDHDARRADLTA